MITSSLTQHVVALATERGVIEIAPGTYLNSRENLQADQATWGEEDLGKVKDFSAATHWVSTVAGDDPLPIDGADDIDLWTILAENEGFISLPRRKL